MIKTIWLGSMTSIRRRMIKMKESRNSYHKWSQMGSL